VTLADEGFAATASDARHRIGKKMSHAIDSGVLAPLLGRASITRDEGPAECFVFGRRTFLVRRR
jgi:hypothetical protein